MSSTAHLSTSELLRVRDGRPHGLGEARWRTLRDLRAHVHGCLQCTAALVELHYARVGMQQRAEREGASAMGPASKADAAPSLRALLQERDVPPPSQWLPVSDPAVPGSINISRYLIAGLVLVVAAGSAWFLRPDTPTDMPPGPAVPPAASAPAGTAPAANPGAAPAATPIIVTLKAPVADSGTSAPPPAE
jgi:hypothetical protein